MEGPRILGDISLYDVRARNRDLRKMSRIASTRREGDESSCGDFCWGSGPDSQQVFIMHPIFPHTLHTGSRT